MNKLWADRAWDDYLYWQMQDKKTVKKINELGKYLCAIMKMLYYAEISNCKI